MHSTKAVRLVSMIDPAVDRLAMGKVAMKYIESRDDETMLRFVKGREPAWFHLQPLNTSIFSTWVANGSSEFERHRRAFQFAVQLIERCPLVTGEVVPAHVPTAVQKSPTEPLKYFTEAELNEIPPVLIDEIGSVAFQRSYCPKELGGGLAPPPSFLRAYSALLSRDVARAAELLRSQNSDALQEEARIARGGAPDIGAPATEADTSPADLSSAESK